MTQRNDQGARETATAGGSGAAPRRWAGRLENQTAPYDLLLRGGEVLDPSQGLRGVRDVAFAWGRIAAVAEPGTIDPRAARTVIDVAGKLVTPGLIDLHTHVYLGAADLCLPADEVGAASGCTTMVDAGTASANNMLGFHRLVQRETRTRIYALVHISGIGLVGHPHGESRDLTFLEPELAARCLLSYQGFVLGVKVRQSHYIVGDNGLEPLRRAIRAAELAEQALRPAGAARRVPVMVHIGGAPAPLAEILALLRPGDVITHCFTGTGNGVVDDQGRLEPACEAARQRGILFDVGHGSGSFSLPIAKAAAEAGFWPDTISTDLHAYSVNRPAIDLPATMSKFLSLGLSLEEVVRRATEAPAQFINASLPPSAREPLLGTLQAGAPGDAAVLELQHGDFEFVDTRGHTWHAPVRLVAAHTVLAGRQWGRPFPNPYLVP
jgi:dihydroorotase